MPPNPMPHFTKKMLKTCFCCVSDMQYAEKLKKSKSKHYPWEIYTLKELVQATNNFHENNKLGEGGFGSVYWGRIANGTEIAVKRLKTMTAKTEMEFAVEVEILGRVRHKNLLGLRGFYAGGQERLIVYDYMPNQSLMTHLHGHLASDVLLDWSSRFKIAIGCAEGLAYLHHKASPHIIHRDIKASNVLLDSDFHPKVADFGFAKLIPEGVSHLTTRVKGTLGYLAPEYAMWGKVSESCDVYSYGVLLLEIVSSKKPIEKHSNGVKRDIVRWAKPLVERGRLEQMVDPRLKGRFDRGQLETAVMVGMRCVSSNPENRPTMAEIVAFLRSGAERRKKDVVGAAAAEEEEDESYESGYSSARSFARRMRAGSELQ